MGNNLNKGDVIDRVAKKLGGSKAEAEKALNAVIDTIEDSVMQGDKITLVGFGSFELRERAERSGRNPQTGETIQIAAKKAPAAKLTFGKTKK